MDRRAFFVIGVGVAIAAFVVVAGVVVGNNQSEGEAGTGASLVGPVWQWQEFLGGDDSVVAPDDPSEYTIQFESDGSVLVQADCNQGSGTYTEDNGTLDIQVSGVTLAQCEQGSLGDRYLQDLREVRTYVIEDGVLFLNLMADAGDLRHVQS